MGRHGHSEIRQSYIEQAAVHCVYYDRSSVGLLQDWARWAGSLVVPDLPLIVVFQQNPTVPAISEML